MRKLIFLLATFILCFSLNIYADAVTVNAVDTVPQGAKAIASTNENNNSQTSAEYAPETEPFQQTDSSDFMNLYLVLFFIIAGLVYYFYKNNKIEIKNGDRYIYLILGCVIILKIILAPIVEGFSTDIGCFKSWSNYAALDLPNFYNSGFFCDYPPLYIYVLFILGKIIQIFNISYDSNMALILIKLPSILADSFTAYLLFTEAKKFLNKEAGMMLAMLYVFNPAVILNSTLWGQVDSFFAMFIVLMVINIRKEKLSEASIMLALAILMKPQGIIFMPILLFEVVRTKNWMTFFSCLANGITTAIITILPFSFHQNPFWIFKLYMNTADGYKYASLNAFNLFALLGANLKPDSETFILLSYGTWGYIFIVLITLSIAWIYWKSKVHFIASLTSACILMGVFMLSARMHERYLFTAVTLLLFAFIYFKDKRLLLLHLGFTFTMFMNTQAVLKNMLKTGYPHVSPDNGFLIGISFVNVVLFIILIRVIRNILFKIPSKKAPLEKVKSI